MGNWASFLEPSQVQTAFSNNFGFVLDTRVFKGASQTLIRVKMQIQNLSYSKVSFGNYLISYKHTLANYVALIVINHRNMRHSTAAVTWLVRILFKKKA